MNTVYLGVFLAHWVWVLWNLERVVWDIHYLFITLFMVVLFLCIHGLSYMTLHSTSHPTGCRSSEMDTIHLPRTTDCQNEIPSKRKPVSFVLMEQSSSLRPDSLWRDFVLTGQIHACHSLNNSLSRNFSPASCEKNRTFLPLMFDDSLLCFIK